MRPDFIRHLPLAAALLAALPGATLAQGVSFTLDNHTGHELREVYVTPAGDTRWGQNRLVGGPVRPDQAVTIQLRDKTCVYDLRAVFADNVKEERHELNLCSNKSVALHGKAADDPSFRLTNHLKQPIVELNASPVGKPRAANLLATAPLAPEASIPLHPVRGQGCDFVLRVVLADKTSKERTLDLCKATDLSIP
jgi:hypothetical protein